MGSNSHVACGWEAAGSWSEGAITDEPYERIVHVRVRGGRRGKLRPLPGSRRRASPRWAASAAAMNWAGCSTTIIGKPRELPFPRSAEFFGSTRRSLRILEHFLSELNRDKLIVRIDEKRLALVRQTLASLKEKRLTSRRKSAPIESNLHATDQIIWVLNQFFANRPTKVSDFAHYLPDAVT